ncbi:MAG: S9 family peptidase, partial [Parafilimonas sp.]
TDVTDPQVSPDGKWVGYTVSAADTAKDKYTDDIWMVNWEGTQTVQLTSTQEEDESTPRFSPDNKYISFLSDRYAKEDDKNPQSQLWLLNRRGGEAKKITDTKNEIEDYVWSPDAKKILLVMKDEDFSDTSASEVRKPYEIDEYLFKRDIEGYADTRRTHLYLFDIETEELDTLTGGEWNESSPAFSPDGKEIAFVSNRTQEPDKNENTDIWVMPAVPHSIVRQLTNWEGTEDQPQWSPDGKSIAYLQTTSNEKFTMYGHDGLMVISKDGGTPKFLSQSIDRPAINPRWSKDGKSIFVLMEDDRQQIVAQFNVADGSMKRIANGEKVFYNLELNEATGTWLTSIQTPQMPPELYALENGNTRRLTHIQDTFLAPLKPLKIEPFTSTSKDGTKVSGILYRPADAVNKKLPLILYIHGGPVGQDDYEYDLYRNILAANGYAVAAVNYRGSSGRGIDFVRAIYADWGDKEVTDIIGAADYLIAQGVADSSRMGISGWSYGGILTDYTIATDTRFKAAASGAGSALQLSMYGIDQYIVQYEAELGPPWKNMEKWIQLSYPFFHADRITTPTLFMASQKDFNVPAAGAEQMYQALRSLGVPAKLIIYPDQYHEITVLSYLKHRFESYLDWFGKYLK